MTAVALAPCWPHPRPLASPCRRHTKFDKILNAYCQKKAMDVAQVRFVFDGMRVNPANTPDDVGMDDGDTIDAFLVS